MAEQSPRVLLREDFDRRYLLLAAIPLGIYILFYLVLAETRNAGIAFKVAPNAEFESLAYAEAKYRYLWVSAFWASCVVSLAVTLSCFLTLYRETPWRHRLFVLSLVVFFSAAIAAYEVVYTTLADQHWYDYMGAGLYMKTLGQMPVSIEQPFETVAYAESILRKLDIALVLVKLFGTAALVTVGAGSLLTLTHLVADADGVPEPTVESKVRHLTRNVALLKAYLYQGTAVFVFAVVAMISWMLWPIELLSGDEVQANYRDLMVGSAILQGVGYTVAVASLYLPPAVMLRQRVRRMAKQALVGDEDANVEAWLRKRGLQFRPLDELRQVAVVLLPALVSALPALMNF